LSENYLLQAICLIAYYSNYDITMTYTRLAYGSSTADP